MHDSRRLRLILTVGTPLTYCLTILLSALVGLRLSLDGYGEVLGIALFVSVSSLLASRFNLHLCRAFVECVGCGLLITIPMTISTYIAMHANFPLADAQLAQWDNWLGLDWPNFLMWVDQHPLVATAFSWAYRSFHFQLMLLPMILVVLNKTNRAYQMVIAYGLLCFASAAVSTFWPAVGTYTFYDFDAKTLANVDWFFGYSFLDQFHAVRDDPAFVWRLNQTQGILTFPSVHAAVALLCAWAMWPVRLLRYPALALNVAMATSAVPCANHYAIDVLAGCLIAMISIIIVKYVSAPSAERVQPFPDSDATFGHNASTSSPAATSSISISSISA